MNEIDWPFICGSVFILGVFIIASIIGISTYRSRRNRRGKRDD